MFVIFRLGLSLMMFAVLLGGLYTAYKHFSGLDPLKLDPQAVLKDVMKIKTPDQFLALVSTLGQSTQGNNSQAVLENLTLSSSKPASGGVIKFLLITDTHSDNDNLQKAINQARQTYPDLSFIIGLGDYSTVGILTELKEAKVELDRSGLRYFLIAGDHDLWDGRDKQKDPGENYKQVFGPLYQSFTLNNFKFLLLDNSDNYKGISKEQQDWITDQLEKSKKEGVSGVFVFIHEPLYHPSSDHFMGRVEKDLKQQAQSLIFQLKAFGVKKIFSGDIHYFSEYEEPVTKLSMVTVGAVSGERNPQIPRFAVVTVFADGLTKVEDVEIK